MGISLDGPKDIHDKYRKDKGGFPTFDRVMSGLNILKGEGVEFNTMSTVNHASEGRGLETYLFCVRSAADLCSLCLWSSTSSTR